MTILTSSTRKSFKNRILIYTMYTLLIIGATSMVYPFLLLLSGSSKSGVDGDEFNIIPKFIYNSEALYRKDVESFLNEKESNIKLIYNLNKMSFKDIHMPEYKKKDYQLLAEWNRFLSINKSNIPNFYYDLGYIRISQSKKTQPLLLRQFQTFMTKKYSNNLNKFNNSTETELTSWNSFIVREETFLERERTYQRNPIIFIKEFRKFKENQRSLQKNNNFNRHIFLMPSIFFAKKYPKQKNILTQTYNELKNDELSKRNWIDFVRYSLNPLWIQPNFAENSQVNKKFQKFLKAKYNHKIALLNKNYSKKYISFTDVILPNNTENMISELFTDWGIFIHGWQSQNDELFIAKPTMLKISGIEFKFRKFLLNKSKTFYTTDNVSNIIPPQQLAHYQYFKNNQPSIVFEFIKRNFIAVFAYIFLKGRALLNTIIYCTMAVLFALLINPLAAYCLSRFKPKSTYKFLLFFMLTMAFPPMVTQIPVFIMLREFNLLNTFWALVLPTMANGYAIFLLKGFFDSIPQELYESAQIDGANEFRIFYQITLSLSKPILAVIALQTFTIAYSNFMMALLICQDQKMWTIMPWLYMLHSNSGEGVIFASLVIAAIPTLLVFSLCQNIIIKGIIVPVEK